MSDFDKKTGGIKVEIFRLANSLKDKLGTGPQTNETGFIAPEAIAEADRLILELCKECPVTLNSYLDEISALWRDMRELPASPAREEIAQKIFTLAHEIKDVGSMCGFNLAAYFAESLRDYIARTELSLEAQRVIIQAHVDALFVVLKKGMREEDGAQAEELKKMVKVAVDKYR
jgi:chemotaxis protein histidine kinase CheA